MQEVTTQEIQNWKKQYGDIFLISFEDGKKVYLKKPDRKTLSYAMTRMQNNPLGFAETILNNCFIGGDQEVKTEDSYFLGAASQLEAMVETKQAELKKL